MIICKNCKWKYNPNASEDCWCYWVDTNENDYCSKAEPGSSYQLDACTIFDDRHNYIELGPLLEEK